MAVSDGDDAHRREGPGPRVARVRRPHPRRPRRATWPSATAATPPPGRRTWRNAQPVYRGVGDRQFALGHNGNLTNTEALAEEAGMLPGTVTSDTDLIAELLGRRAGARCRRSRSDERDLERALARRAAPARGRLLPRADGRGPRHRRPRPQRLPPAVPRQARQRLGAGVGEPGPRHRRRPLRPRARPRRDGRHRRHRAPLAAPVPRRARSTRGCACSSSSTSPAPTAASTARASTRPGSAWASSWPSRRRSRPTW